MRLRFSYSHCRQNDTETENAMDRSIGRRPFLQGAGLAVLSAAIGQPGQAQVAVPNSSGTELPKLKAPALACDCHHHIYDPGRFAPLQPGTVANARVPEYRLLQRRVGTTRDIVVTPRPYVTDNRVTLDAIAQLGNSARGVAVIHPTVTDAELQALARGGIRGIRFSLAANPNTVAATTVDMIEPLSKRVNTLGWHVQIAMDADQIVAAGGLWNRIPSVIVFDHMGYIPGPVGLKHPAFALIRRLIDKGRTWVKLSVIPANTKDGPPTYADVNKVGQAYVQAAPERMVWGSNWPHPNEANIPDDAVLFDLLAEWAPNEAMRHRILVENPTELYFSKNV
jgi:predicted TIM-barrel fold metal-dependent hydrolase